jgi:hypothetical protein
MAGLLFTAEACAASYGSAGRYQDLGYAVDLQRRAYSNGYEEGLEQGTAAATAIPNSTGPHFVAGSLRATTTRIGRTSAMDIANGSDNARRELPRA